MIKRAAWLWPRARGSLGVSGLYVSRTLSSDVTRTIHISQGGKLSLNLFALSKATVVVSSKWQDHVEVSSKGSLCGLSFTENKDENSAEVIASPRSNQCHDFPSIEVLVPEYLDIAIDAQEIDLSLLNKLQGDMSITCKSGTIVADKLRGESLDFNCGTADLTIRKMMEGSANIECRALKAKMINGDSINVNAEHVSVDVMYGEHSVIQARDDITVGLLKGSIAAHSESGNVSVSGIDGSFDLHADKGSIRLQINKLYPAPDYAMASRDRTGSHATAPEGHIAAVVDPELAASIHCESESAGMQRVCTTVNSDAFELHSDPDCEVHTPRAGTWEGGVIQGFLTGKSAGVKRPTFGKGGAQSGKIDLLGAEAQAQQMGGAHHHSADTSTPRNPIATASATTGATAESEQGGYDINLFARGNVRIDTMSWIQIIRSKYGFEDNITGKAPAPGRTASANMNAAKVANSVLFNDKSA